MASGTVPVKGWSCIRDGRCFPLETFQRGEPTMRPETGRVVLARTAGMAALEQQFRGRALYVTIVGGRRVTSTSLLATLKRQCDIDQTAVVVEVAGPPYHFFVRFNSDEDCMRVVDLQPELRCDGAYVNIRRWSLHARGAPGKLEYKTVLSIEGLPDEAWEPQAVNLLLAGLGGELIEILPTNDRWVLPISAWLRDPFDVPKVLTLTVPAPPLPPTQSDSIEDGESPPPPTSPTKKNTQNFNLLIHVKEVIDRGPLLTEGITGASSSDEDEDLSRRHTFQTWRGKIDGTGPDEQGYA